MPVPVPAWVATLQMAQDWGMRPWLIEEEAPILWTERWQAYNEAYAKGKKLKKQHG